MAQWRMVELRYAQHNGEAGWSSGVLYTAASLLGRSVEREGRVSTVAVL